MNPLRLSSSCTRPLTRNLSSCLRGAPPRIQPYHRSAGVALRWYPFRRPTLGTTITTIPKYTTSINTSQSRSVHNINATETSGSSLTHEKRENATQAEQLYELSLGLSRTPANGNVEMQTTIYNAEGTSTTPTQLKLTKLDIAQQYGLSARDLRAMDLPTDGFPHILIRESTMLIHLFNLRLLVQADRMLLFHVDGQGQGQTQGKGPSSIDNTTRVFTHDLTGKLRGDRGLGVSTRLPYELRVLEAALAATTSTLEAEYVLAKERAVQALRTLDVQMQDKEESVIHSDLRELLDLVRRLAGIEQRARHVRSAVQEVLNEDEDMAAMHLTDKKAGMPHRMEDHQDVEYLLEAYYKASDRVVQETGSLMRNIQQTEQTIQSILDVRRNQIMVLEAKVEICMLGLAAATLVAGLYGMNVPNYWEEMSWAFGLLVSVCLLGTVGISRYGMRQLRRVQRVHL
ncbi:CorA family magnesium transporter [Aspergillus affinis]|uniref:CorA family magnesium transporter n=1 Tax=Aspergillus affinis TaxID=1070780 RepID=UPI0022FDFB8C|nr:putative RNA splicing protein mrs2 [Aspergillus affinis]KAI9043291.1 putative RNA splicing protein mrs2 [Aspergillus affinis]